MPLHPPRSLTLLLGLVLLVGLVAVPGVALAGRPTRPATDGDTWLVLLRQPDGRRLPTRRGGVRAGAARIARERAAVTSATIDRLEARGGFRAAFRYTYAVSGFAARLSQVQLAALRQDPAVRSLRRSRPVRLAGEVVPVGVTRVKAPPSSAPAGIGDVRVAVVDTGVGRYLGTPPSGSWRHGAELDIVTGVDAHAGQATAGPCAGRMSDTPPEYDDDYGHGTHVAGTVGAADNAVGAVGVAPGVQLVSVRVFQNGNGSDATVTCGLDWIVAYNILNSGDEAKDIDVVNMSLRGPDGDNPHAGCDDPLNGDLEELAVCALTETGVHVVVAAGNEDDNVENYIPSRYASVITVSAISDFDGVPGSLTAETCPGTRGRETDDTFARYSNWGDEIDITAPGTCVVSTDLGSAAGTVMMTGTSMATPHVTGAIARYLAGNPNLTPAAMEQKLKATANVDWDAITDPDGEPDRLLDVAALTATDPAIRIYTVPLAIPVAGATTGATVRIRLQRIGGYSGAVDLAAGPLPDGVASVDWPDGATIPADGLNRSLGVTFEADPPDGTRELDIEADAVVGDHTDQAGVVLRFDGTPPTIGAPWPQAALRTGTWTDRAPVRLAWSVADGQSGIDRQEVQRSRDGGSFGVIARPGAATTSLVTSVEKSVTTAWRIRAWDRVDNGVTSSTLATVLAVRQSGLAVLSSGWAPLSANGASNNNVIRSGTAGATATLTFSGRSVAIVAPTASTLGTFKVRIDGSGRGIIDQSAGSNGARRILFATNDLGPGQHTIRVVVLTGTVDLDAFLVLQ